MVPREDGDGKVDVIWMIRWRKSESCFKWMRELKVQLGDVSLASAGDRVGRKGAKLF